MLRRFQKALSQIATWLSTLSNYFGLPRFNFGRTFILLSLDQKIFLCGLFILPLGYIWRFESFTPLIFGLLLDFLTPSIHLSEILFIISFALYIYKNPLNLNLVRTLMVSTLVLLLTFQALMSPFPLIGLWRVLKLLEASILAFYVSKNFHVPRFRTSILFVLVISMIVQITLGLTQFFAGNSLNLRLLGGHFFELSTLGIAKIAVNGREYLRAYGTLPHPNILAGFIALSFPLALSMPFFVKRIGYLIFGLFLTGFILTFSRQAWLALIIGLLSIVKWNKFRKFKVSLSYLMVLIITIYAFGILVLNRTQESFNLTSPPIFEREILIKKSIDLIIDHPIFGVGLGQSTYALANAFPSLDSTLFQPAHNLFVLSLVEMGLLGGILFLSFIGGVAYIIWAKRDSKSYLKKPLMASFIIFLIISLFDHYFLTLDQGLLILGVYTGLWVAAW